MTKKNIWVEVKTEKGWRVHPSLEGPLDGLIDLFEAYKKSYGEYSDLEIRFEYDYGDTREPFLYGKRLETDSEYEARLKSEEKNKKQQDEWDRKKFEELKRKFKE